MGKSRLQKGVKNPFALQTNSSVFFIESNGIEGF